MRAEQDVDAVNPRGQYVANLGHQTDVESNLIYMRARYYDPGTARFVTEDRARGEFSRKERNGRKGVGRAHAEAQRRGGTFHAKNAMGAKGFPQGPRPKAQGPRPKAQGPRPKAQGPRPKAQGPRPKAQGPRPKAQGPRPRTKAQGPRPKAQGPRPKA
ncbi:MAG: hypothetical protein H6534_02645 [Chthonomonadaceae bacterium]|nr:hypothetical protein [Chthonomonadaceae bacterium]